MTSAAGMGDISRDPTSRQLMATERRRIGLLLYLVIYFQMVIPKKYT